jgi:CRISPR/Cas system Type II protein with McrA/HNH and RuvC-like nuclease domain
MINCEQDLLVNLIELSPRNARRKFRQSIFESWEWKCAYCDKDLDEKSATIDHILPKFKGGHNVKSNMVCSCSKCNRSKGSVLLEDWYNSSNSHYSEERLGKIKHWIEDNSAPIKLVSSDKATPYITNDFYIGWIST